MFIIKAAVRGANQILRSGKGFTLVESLISILLIALMAIASEGLIAYFAKYTKQDLTGACLLQAASSGIEAKRANPAVSSIAVTCAGQMVHVSMTGNPPSLPPAIGSGTSDLNGTDSGICSFCLDSRRSGLQQTVFGQILLCEFCKVSNKTLAGNCHQGNEQD